MAALEKNKAASSVQFANDRSNMAASNKSLVPFTQYNTVQLYRNERKKDIAESLMMLPLKDEGKGLGTIKEGKEQDTDTNIDYVFGAKRHISMLHTLSVMENYSDYLRTPQIIAMVGLPARGKTYIARKLCRYLNWIGFKTRVFNFGEYRRSRTSYLDHNIFSRQFEQGRALLELSANEAIVDAQRWISENDGEIAILDATNSTLERRRKIQDFAEENGYKLFFIESICTDQKVVEKNITEVKLKSADYQGRQPKEIIADFQKRIQHYEEKYIPLNDIEEPDIRYIKLINAGDCIEIVRHEGPIQSRIIYYLMSLQLLPHDIYLTRHGESTCNVKEIVGGDCELSPQGEKYAEALSEFFENLNIPNLKVWTSRLKRTIQTAKHFKCFKERWEALNEINVGICDGMTFQEINEKYPELNDTKYVDKFHFRYPDGESYKDVIERLETVIMGLERESNILVITHAAVIRCLLGYFLEIPSDQIPYLNVPLHTLFKLSPITYGCKVQHLNFPIEITESSLQKNRLRRLGKCQCVYTIK